MDLELSIPAFDPLPPQYYLRAISDSWVACEMLLPVSFKHVMLPSRQMPYTDLIDLTPLPTAALHEPKFEQLYEKFPTFNPIQTQLFHVLYHTDSPVLLGAPTGSGKTITAELALLRMKKVNPKAKCVYIAPLKSLARERLKEWRGRLGSSPLNWSVLELSGDTHHDARALNKADVLVCTPEKWDLITRGWRGGKSEEFTESPSSTGKKFIKDVRLLVIDEIHLLGEERGAVLEAIVSRTRFISKFIEQEQQDTVSSGSDSNLEATRIIGLSTALANPYDLADWIGINVDGHDVDAKRGLYNFRPSVRPIPMEVHIQGFPGRHYCPRMATMNKPCYAAIKEHSPKKPVIIFVASRRQTRLTALELINYAAGDENPTAFLGCTDAYVESIASTITDASLRHTLSFGVGLHHAGLASKDRETVERMFLNGDIQVLCATATLAWGVNLPAHLVIVKGTEFFDGKTHRYVDYPVTDVLQMMGRAGRPQFDTSGKACIFVAEGKKNFYKKFLYEPFPVESCLGARLCENINAEIAIGTIHSIVEAVGYLSWTFYARRVKMNPSFYGAKSSSEEDVEDFFFSAVKGTIKDLAEHGCVKIEDNLEKIEDNCAVSTTVLGLATSNYYLQYRTPMQMREGAREVRNIITRKLEAIGEIKVSAGDGDDIDDENEKTQIKPNQPCSYSIPADIEVASVAHTLYSLSKTHEFDEHPVRHNEEEHNAELSEEVPWGPNTDIPLGRKNGRYQYSHTDEDMMAEPHTKCFLLLQANLASIKLPVTDYITDTRSVMDQIPRLLAAMQYVSLDDSGVSGTFDLMCTFAVTRQVVQAKSMPGTNPLEQITLPRDAIRKLKSKGMRSLRDLRIMPSSESLNLLKSVCERGKRGNSSANAAARDLSAIPLPSIEEVKCYCEVEKTGKSVGVLKFNLIVAGEYGKRGGGGGGGGGRRKGNKDDKEGAVGLMAVLGTHQGRFLLNHKSLSGISLRGNREPSKRSIEMKFDWQKANAHGGIEGGFVTLRLLCENVRGMDVEVLVPLR